jgi:Tol biopolymer transport system component
MTTAAIVEGALVSHYRIRSRLGAGGMGVVYLAEDTRLGRKVALKTLPAELTSDPDRLRRFEQEARAASSLNHPNILTIFDIGEVDGAHFIAAEFIEGETLRERLGRGRMELAEALDVAVQVASALAAAHQVGIIHRDVKPENVMLRTDGYAKVVDFGLAKLEGGVGPGSQVPTRAKVETSPGTVMGTATYMSPEQVRALALDARTDVFSLGATLHEMITGRPPFDGASTADVMAAILTAEPPPIARERPEAPAELQRIVGRALRKDREERYQIIKEMLVDLKAVRRELNASPGAGTGLPSPPSATAPLEQRTPPPAAAQPTMSSAEYLAGEVRRHRWLALLGVAALLGVLAAFGLVLHRAAGRRPPAPRQAMRVTRLTNIGRVGDAAISPDGRYVAHVVFEHGKQALVLRQVTTNSTTTVVPPGDDALSGPIFGRDGDYLYYLKSWSGAQWSGAQFAPAFRALYRVPVLGGTAQKVVAHVSSPVTFSPDGKKLAFHRAVPGEGVASLLLANADGSGETTLLKRDTARQPAVFTPAWSPDGTVIAWPEVQSDTRRLGISLIAPDGTGERRLGTRTWGALSSIAWLGDGSGLLAMAADEDTSFRFQVFSVSYPGGQAERITNDVSTYAGLSLTGDSRSLLTIEVDPASRLWVARSADVATLRPITSGRTDGLLGVSWAPDGRLVQANRDYDLWIMDSDGSNARLLTPDSHTNRYPSVSSDGRYIVFESWRGRYMQPPTLDRLWRIDIDGGNPTHLPTAGTSSLAVQSWPQVTPDSRAVIYDFLNPQRGGSSIGRVSMDGKDPRQLTSELLTIAPAISPDGTRIAATFRNNPMDLPGRIGLFPIEGGKPTVAFEGQRGFRVRGIRWMPDGRALTYFVDRAATTQIWMQPVAGGPPRPLADFEDDYVFWHDWSRDGRLAVARGAINRDAVLITNFH